MPLVRLVEPQEADPSAAPMLESGMAQYGMALNTWQALLHRPEIFTTYLPYLRAVVGPGKVPGRTKDLAAIAVAIANGCRYSASHRVAAGLKSGISPDEIDALAADRLDDFGPDERLAIRYGRELTLAPPAIRYADNPQAVDAGLLAALTEAFDEPQIVELTATIALWNALTRFHRVMGLPLDMPPPPSAIDAVL
ncbi:MAG: carboxymuconolactone decarboxylase family protein [Candidatus Limnocylindria bacterium]